MRRDRKRLVKNQEGFEQHVDPAENPELDFNKVTIGSNKSLNYVNNSGHHRCEKIRCMAWGWDPWASEANNRLVKDMPGFSEHVEVKENPGLNFDTLTIGADEKIKYTDDSGCSRYRRISDIEWNDDPWKKCASRYVHRPLLRDQEGFSKHVLLSENPELDFDDVTIGSSKYLNYWDDNGEIRNKRISKMRWDKNPWEGKLKKCPLVRDQEGFSAHVLLSENPGLDFNELTIGSTLHLNYRDNKGEKRTKRISKMPWSKDPWIEKNKRRPRVCDQEGFSAHVFLSENPDLDFNKITTGSIKNMIYWDDNGKQRNRKIRDMSWKGNPWVGEKEKHPLLRDQKDFKSHVNASDNPNLNFDKVTTGSDNYLNYIDDDGYKRNRIISKMAWDGNPWKGSKKMRPLLCNQEGFCNHVVLSENPHLDFEKVRIGSSERLYYRDDNGVLRHRIIRYMAWHDNPWKGRSKKKVHEVIGEDPDFWNHCDEADPKKIEKLKKRYRNCREPVKMHCDKGHRYVSSPNLFYCDVKESCPYCAGRLILPNETDVATLDPELELFFISEENDEDIHKISPKATTRIKWKCPYCGHRFKRSVRLMVNKHPKCSACLDTGMTDASNLNNEGDSHMIVVRNGDKDD